MKIASYYIHQLIAMTGIAATMSFAASIVLEFFEPGFVTNWFHPGWFLLISALTGLYLLRVTYGHD